MHVDGGAPSMTTGFYWAKVYQSGPWSVVFVYSDGSWSSVWWADPRCGLLGDLAVLGSQPETPDGERSAYPVDPVGYMESLQHSRDQIIEEMRTAEQPHRAILQNDLTTYQKKIGDLADTMSRRLPREGSEGG